MGAVIISDEMNLLYVAIHKLWTTIKASAEKTMTGIKDFAWMGKSFLQGSLTDGNNLNELLLGIEKDDS